MQMWSGSSATFYAKLFHVGTKNKYLDLAIFKIADCLLAPLTSVATTPVQGMAFRKTEVQCSPLQAVTGKIYRLKQHFLPPATAWSVTKIKYTVSCFKKYASCGPSRSTQEKEVYTEKRSQRSMHIYSQWLLYLTLGGGVDGTLPPEFSICCSISKRFYLKWKDLDLLNKMRYVLRVIALPEACDVTNNSRHLGFYQELEIRLQSPEMVIFLFFTRKITHK